VVLAWYELVCMTTLRPVSFVLVASPSNYVIYFPFSGQRAFCAVASLRKNVFCMKNPQSSIISGQRALCAVASLRRNAFCMKNPQSSISPSSEFFRDICEFSAGSVSIGDEIA